jgi:hypothetical protein
MEWYAHRVVLPVLVLDIEVVRSSDFSGRQIEIKLNVSQSGQSPDIDFLPVERYASAVFWCYFETC